MLGVAFDAIFNDRPFTLPFVSTGWLPSDPSGQLFVTIGLLVCLKVIDITAAVASNWAFFVYSHETIHRIRVRTFDALGQRDASFFAHTQTGDLMSVLNDDVNALEEFLSYGVSLLLGGLATIGTALIVMVGLNWRLTLVTLAVLPVLVVVNHWFSVYHERRTDTVRHRRGQLNALFTTLVNRRHIVAALGAGRSERDRVADESAVYRDASRRARITNVTHQPVMRLLAGMAFVCTLFIGTQWTLNTSVFGQTGVITAGQLIPFAYYTQSLVRPVQYIAWFTGMYKAAQASARRLLWASHGTTANTDEDAGQLHPVEGAIEFVDVTVQHSPDDPPALTDVSLTVAPGETVGIVGPSGAGKSTLLELLPRFVEPQNGHISIDDTDIATQSTTAVRDTIGYVTQQPYLFTGTVRENLTYSVGECSDDRLRRATETACAHEFITDLDEGYDTTIGQRGRKLSGGQRQRIAIVRMLLTDPDICIFDEATSEMDTATQWELQENILAVTDDSTTLVVAHRLSTIRSADRIVVVDEGTIAEQGTHEHLLANGGLYATLWDTQTGESEYRDRPVESR